MRSTALTDTYFYLFGGLGTNSLPGESDYNPDEGRYRIIAGARRRAAAKRIGLQTIPVVVRTESEANLRVLQLIENLQRQDLSPIDEASAYKELMVVSERPCHRI